VGRPPRIDIEGAIHHVTNRGQRRAAVMVDDRDRHAFSRLYADAARRSGWRCLSLCLMTNHFHLVVETPNPTLSQGMHVLASRYAHHFNTRHEKTGHVFEARFYSRHIDSDEYFAQVLRYVARNPVGAGLRDDPAEWPWSTHAATVAGASTPFSDRMRVEELLEPWGGAAGTRYRRLFAATHPVAVKYGDSDPFAFRPPLAELLAAGYSGIAAAREHGYRLREIADWLGCSESTVSRRARNVPGTFLAR
jgi:putative transposase